MGQRARTGENTLAKRRKRSSLSSTIAIVGAALAVLVTLVIDYWPYFLAAIAVVLVYCLYRRELQGQARRTRSPQAKRTTSPIVYMDDFEMKILDSIATAGSQPKQSTATSAERIDEDELQSFSPITAGAESDDYKIPPAGDQFMSARWLSKAESLTIAGIKIGNGLFYVGPTLHAANGDVEPSLIDPRKPVAKTGHYTDQYAGHWSSYSDMPPQARRAYLLFLADGKSAPGADIRYVFLYFYGLERRIFLDILGEERSQEELPQIAKELKRLYATYASDSVHFEVYCERLIQILDAASMSPKLYEQELGELGTSPGLPFPLQLALGQAVRDNVPIPAQLAFAWIQRASGISRKTPARRCPEEFKKLFLSEYAKAFGLGLKIDQHETMLTLNYLPASRGFVGSPALYINVEDATDVTTLVEPLNKLQAIAESCTNLLDPYSRYLGRNPDGRQDFEAILMLPFELWPDAYRKAVNEIKAKASIGSVLLSLRELFAAFSATIEPTKDLQLALSSVLEAQGVGMEPDIFSASRAIKPEDPVVLFETSTGVQEISTNPAYTVAKISVELAAAVAQADGDFSDSELAHLNLYIDRWGHLNVQSRQRLKAYALMLVNSSVVLSSIKKKVEQLDKPTREAIAAFASAMVLADGVALPEEVKVLEKIYLYLELERVAVYSDIHSGHSNALSQPDPNQLRSECAAPGFALDPVKIAALKEESEKIARRLAAIFVDELAPEPAVQQAAPEPQHSNSFLGLDLAHSTFARLLMSRTIWQRAELIDVAQDLNIMLDGALEKLNEASLDELDTTFSEGDDPVEINPELIENMTQ